MPVLRSVNTVCDGRKAYAKAVVQVRPDLKIEVRAPVDLRSVGLGVIGKRWSARLHHPSQVRAATSSCGWSDTWPLPHDHCPGGGLAPSPTTCFREKAASILLIRRHLMYSFSPAGCGLRGEAGQPHGCPGGAGGKGVHDPHPSGEGERHMHLLCPPIGTSRHQDTTCKFGVNCTCIHIC